jgi:tyrosine-protein phosphatase SIW14
MLIRGSSLVKKGFPIEFQDFVKGNGIRHCIIDMQGTKKVDIPEIMMQSIMKIVLDQDNYPLLIHCNHGKVIFASVPICLQTNVFKHRTGCAVAVLRHVTGWNVDAIIEEYSGFAEPKIRDCDLKYIREYQVSSLQGLFTTKKLPKPPARNRAKMAQLLVYTALVLSIWFITAYFW